MSSSSSISESESLPRIDLLGAFRRVLGFFFFSGGFRRSPLYSITPAVAILHSSISVEKSSQLPRSVKPTMKSLVLLSFIRAIVGMTRTRRRSAMKSAVQQLKLLIRIKWRSLMKLIITCEEWCFFYI